MSKNSSRNRGKRRERYGSSRVSADQFGFSGHGFGKNKVFSGYVVTDKQGKPMRCFAKLDEAEDFLSSNHDAAHVALQSFCNFGNQE